MFARTLGASVCFCCFAIVNYWVCTFFYTVNCIFDRETTELLTQFFCCLLICILYTVFICAVWIPLLIYSSAFLNFGFMYVIARLPYFLQRFCGLCVCFFGQITHICTLFVFAGSCPWLFLVLHNFILSKTRFFSLQVLYLYISLFPFICGVLAQGFACFFCLVPPQST